MVGNDRCLVVFESLPSPIRTAELPLPTFTPLGCVPLPVPILIPPSLMVPPDRPASTNGSGDATNERIINAVLMTRDFLLGGEGEGGNDRDGRDRDSILFPPISHVIPTLRCHSAHWRKPSASRRHHAVAYTRTPVAVTPPHRQNRYP